MARQSSASHRDDGKSDFNIVFIDTNLDTHLALVVSDADTVSDFKKRIMLEHPLCFPKTGQIQVHAIKVKRKGHFYHLSDSMLVRSAFSGFNKSWFLIVDASALMEHEKNQISNSPASSNEVVCRGIANNALIYAIDFPLSCPSKRASDFNSFESPQFEKRQDDKEEVPFVSPCVSEHSGKGVAENLETGVKPSGNDEAKISTPGPIPETKDQSCVNHEPPSSHIEYKVEGSSQGNNEECNLSEEGTLKSVPSMKKERKSIRKKEDTVQDDAFKEKNTPVLGENNITDEAAKETEITKEYNECNNNNVENSIDAECNKSMKETSGSGANKKYRKRKRSLIRDSKEEMLKVESASQQAELQKSNKAQKMGEEPKEQVEFNDEKSGDVIEFQHNKVSQEPSDIRSPAKKKQKGKERSGDKSSLEEKRNIVSDIVSDSNKEPLKPENVSQQSVEDLQKIKNSSVDQSTEHFDDADPLRTSIQGSKRKRKKNSSNCHQTAVGTFSRNDDEAEHSRIYIEGVQEGIHQDSQISKDISVSKISGDNIELGTNACEKGTTSKVKRIGNSKDHCATDMKVHPSDLNEPKEVTEDNRPDMHENNAPDHSHISEADQTEQVEEGREISLLDDPKPLPSEVRINQNYMDTNIRELNVTSNVLEAAGTTEGGKSEKKRRRKSNVKDSGAGPAPTGGLSCVDAYTEDNRPDTHENIAPGHSHLSEADQTEQVEEGRAISLLDDPKPLLSENCMPINQNYMDANIRELNVTTKVLEASGTTEGGKSEKKTRKKRNVKDSGGGPAPAEGLSCVDAYKSDTFSIESHKATNCDPSSGNTTTEENLLNKTEGENVPAEEMKGTSLSATDREVNDINGSSLEKISKTEAHAENVREKKSKKSKKKQTPATNGVSEMVTKDQVLDYKEQSPTSESRKLEEPSKITKKNKSASTKFINKSSGPILEPPHSMPKEAEGNYKPPLVAADTAIDSMHSTGDEGDNHLEAPSKSYKINAEQHFASEQQQHKDIVSDDISVDKNGRDRVDVELMTRKNRNRLGINHDKDYDKNVSKVHRTGQEVQLSSQSNSLTSTIEEKKRPKVNKASGKSMNLERKNEAFPASDSKLKGFKKMVQNKVGKTSGNNIEGVMSKKEQKKSLLGGTIFKDDSSGTSENEDEKVNDSNSSTRTPSDNSLSSDYSDGDSHAGSYGRKGLETGGRSSIKSLLSGAKGMPIDSILRSSSSYKKAKLTASQMEDSESQQVDFVPDSLADT